MAPNLRFIFGSNEDGEQLLTFSSSISSKLSMVWQTIWMHRKLIYYIAGAAILFFLLYNTIARFQMSSSRPLPSDPVARTQTSLDIFNMKIEGNDSMLKGMGIWERVISRPQALIHLKSGNTAEFHFNEFKDLNPPCTSLPLSIVGKSGLEIDTLGTCIRLYDQDCCYGNSMAIYPKIQEDSSNKMSLLQIQIQKARSIGPCFQNELEQGSFEFKAETGFFHFQKDKRSNSAPDFVIPDGLKVKERLVAQNPKSIVEKHGRSAYFEGEPIKHFLWGHNNRLEFIEAIFQNQNQNQEKNDASSEEFPQQSQLRQFHEDGDELGFYIPLKFKPQKRLLFYQTAANRREMEQVETRITNFLKGNPKEKVEARIDIHYDPETSTRPVKFYYWLKFGQRIQIFLLSNYPES